MGQWGFPLTLIDLRKLIKAYLDLAGRQSIFKDNQPGRDFAYAFINRHPELTLRTPNLIKRTRAAVSPATVESFFEHFQAAVEGIEPENIYNYDETGMKEDPGVAKA